MTYISCIAALKRTPFNWRLFVIIFTLQMPHSFAKNTFFVEPYVGVSKMQVIFNNTYDVANGFFLGGKLGFNLGKRFFIGADYHTGGPYGFHAPLNETEWNTKMIGAGLGIDYRVIRFWLGYYPTDENEDSLSGGTIKGTAIKVGFGLVVSKKLRANLSLVFHDLNEFENSSGSTTPIEGYNAESAHVSISVPLNF